MNKGKKDQRVHICTSYLSSVRHERDISEGQKSIGNKEGISQYNHKSVE